MKFSICTRVLGNLFLATRLWNRLIFDNSHHYWMQYFIFTFCLKCPTWITILTLQWSLLQFLHEDISRESSALSAFGKHEGFGSTCLFSQSFYLIWFWFRSCLFFFRKLLDKRKCSWEMQSVWKRNGKEDENVIN